MAAPLFPEVRVNATVITHAEIAAEAQNHAAPAGKPGLAWRKAAQALAVRALLLEEAARWNLAAEPRELAPGRVETGEEALIRALLDVAIAPEPVTGEAVREAWDASPGRFRSPPLWEVSHILCACAPEDAAESEAARARAEALRRRAEGGGQAFAALAGQESNCPSRARGGSLGQIRPGDVEPAIEVALRGMSPGEVSAPVSSPHGWHILRLNAAAPGAPLPFEAARPHIAEALGKAAWARAARAFVAALAGKAEITGTDLAPIEAGDGTVPRRAAARTSPAGA